ncbi:MAG: hypothetical protein C4554_08910 [Dethiobacter sp.]|jgi:hypothetical protein|nr:MAG: hypothetical protein C4554_08910 [Dethiobacter sp.]
MDQSKRKVIETLLQMNMDHKMHERFYTRRDFEWAAQIRFQADSLQTLAESLARVSLEELEKGGAGTLPTAEEKPVLTIGQLDKINSRETVTYNAILFYGHGGEPVELYGTRETLKNMELTLRATAKMLFGYMENHFSTENSVLLEPKAEWLEAAIWQSRLSTNLFCIATYYRMAAEMLVVARDTLEKADLAGAALLSEDKRRESVLLLYSTSAFLHEAAKFMGMAGTELGCDEDHWRCLQKVLENILSD